MDLQEDVAIEDIQPGDRVTTFTEEEQTGSSSNAETEVDPATWRMLEVEFPQLPQPDGKMLVSRTLKPLSWIEEHGVREGLWILLGAEHGEPGKLGLVKRIHPCPKVKSGPGRVVLSTFQVASDRVLALRFSGWGQEILTTTVHPFWSESRQAWVAAGRLQLGETVRSRDGHGCRLESIAPVAGRHTVYNLEVEGDHVYRVGTGGVLVHNLCGTDGGPLALEQGTVSYRGGAYDKITKPGIEAHHMPAQKSAKDSNLEGWTPENGPAIQMDPEDHKKTMSHGNVQGSGEYREQLADTIKSDKAGEGIRGAMAMEIRDVRRVARNAGNSTKYNGAMREMMNYSRNQGFIPKNPQTKVKRTK